MNCEEFNQQLSSVIESREHSEDNMLRDHGSTCEHCQTRWDEFLLLEELVPAWNSNLPEVNLVDSVASQFNPDGFQSIASDAYRCPAIGEVTTTRERRNFRIGAIKLTAFVAAVLLLLIPFLFRNNQAPWQPKQRIAKSNAPESISDSPNQEEPNLPALLSDVGHSYLGLAHEFGNSFTDVAGLVVQDEEDLPLMIQQQSDSTTSSATWVKDWGRNLKPIGSSVEKAFGFLFDTIPTDRQRPKETTSIRRINRNEFLSSRLSGSPILQRLTHRA